MADRLETELVLTDQVSGAARKAADALKKVEDAAAKAQDKLDFKQGKKLGDAFAKIGLAQESANIKAASKQTKAFADSWAKIGLAQSKAMGKENGASHWLDKGAEEFGHKLRNAVAAAAIAEVIIGGIEKAVDLLKEGVKMAFDEGGKEERRRNAYRLSLGSAEGKESMEDSARMSKGTKFTETEVQDMMLPLRRAGMSQAAARQAFATSADVEAQGGPKTQDMMEAFQKIQNKGGITPKLLQSMQVNQPKFFSALAASIGGGITASEAKKRATEGKVDPQKLMNMLTDAVNERQHGMAGTSAKEDENTMDARLHKLAALPEEYMKHMVDSPGWNVLKDKLGKVLEQLDPESENGRRIMGKLLEAFGSITDVIGQAFEPENVDKFTSAVETMLTVTKGIVAVFSELVSEIQALINLANGETISKMFFKGDTAAQKLKAIDDKRRNIQAGHGDAAARAFADSEYNKVSPSEREDLDRLGKKTGFNYDTRNQSVVAPANRNNGGNVRNFSAPININVNSSHPADVDDAVRKLRGAGRDTAATMSNEVLMSGG